MSAAKYIIIEGSLASEVYVFSNHVTHREVADKIGGEILSAGFVSFEPKILAYGKSISIGIGSRPEDTALIRKHLGAAP